MQAPLLHVSYKEYYRRFFRQFLRDLFKLGSGQVIGALLVISIMILQIHYGVIPRTLTMQAFASIGWPYAIVVFALCVLSAGRVPAQIDAVSQEEISRINKELTLPDNALAIHVSDLLAQVDDNAKKVLKFVLFHDEVSQRNIKIKGVSYQEIDSACRQCRDLGLLKWGNNAPDPHSMIAGMFDFYYIEAGWRETLRRLLYRG